MSDLRRFSLIAVLMLSAFSCRWFGHEDIHILPSGYRGVVVILFDQPGGVPLEMDRHGNATFKIGSDGRMSIGQAPPEAGRRLSFYIPSATGKLERLPIRIDGRVYDAFGEVFGKAGSDSHRFIGYIVGDPSDREFHESAKKTLMHAVMGDLGRAP